MIKYGYFDVKPEIEAESWQINTDDFTIEVQTTLDATPKKLICVYIDDKEQIKNANVSMFIGRLSGNGASGTGHNYSAQVLSESTSFISPDATYLRFDESTKKSICIYQFGEALSAANGCGLPFMMSRRLTL